MREYVVSVRSVPGMYAQYNFEVSVRAAVYEDAIERAYRKIKGDFPDRSKSMWKLRVIEGGN